MKTSFHTQDHADNRFLQELATKILCAELTNGVRTEWAFDFSEATRVKLVEFSVDLAERIICSSTKYEQRNETNSEIAPIN